MVACRKGDHESRFRFWVLAFENSPAEECSTRSLNQDFLLHGSSVEMLVSAHGPSDH